MGGQQEKNILVNHGIPQDSNPGSGNGRGGGRDIPSGYGVGGRGGFLNQDFDGSESVAAWVTNILEEEAAVAAREQEAARIIAAELARKDAEEAARQLAQRQAEEAARQLAQRQAEEAARQLAQRQAEEAARQLAQRQAEEAARQMAQRQAEEAARQLAQRQAEDAARQLAQRQAEEAARQLAQRQAEEAARQLAHRQAEEAARQLAQRQAEEAARQSVQRQAEEATGQLADRSNVGALQLWTAVAGPQTRPNDVPVTLEIAREIARRVFTRSAVRLLGSNLPLAAALYSPMLADAELGPSLFATPVTELGVDPEMDLAFIASRNGTVDVSHRLLIQNSELGFGLRWQAADGAEVGSKVAVRSLTWNPLGRQYEFVLDGDTGPIFIWTPAVTPGSSSTYLPAEVSLPSDLRDTLTPLRVDPTSYPALDWSEFSDVILVFPADSGIGSLYIVVNQRVGDHRYHMKPERLPAFPQAKQVRGKTRIQGGGGTRPRWADDAGNMYEWDYRHGTVEKYNKRGVHLGEYNHETGVQTKKADTTRRVEP